jgi:glyoxylate reductase
MMIMMNSRTKEVYVTRVIPRLSILSRIANERGFKMIVHTKPRPPNADEILENIADKDAILCTVSDKIDAKVIDAAGPNLKVICSYSSGYDHIDIEAATSRGIYVTYVADIPAEATADLTFGLILSCARNIISGDRYVKKKNWKIGWSPNLMLGHNVYRTTLGIVGLGRIGSAVAKRAKGFDMQILYNDHIRKYKEESELGLKFVGLDTLLAESDFVIVCASMNSTSRNMIDKSKLKIMKKTAYLINTARGHIVNEADLAIALARNQIAGAGLDVFENEPVPRTHSLLKMNNVITLPHIGCATYETRYEMAEAAISCLLDVLDGRAPPPAFTLNPEVEYYSPYLCR